MPHAQWVKWCGHQSNTHSYLYAYPFTSGHQTLGTSSPSAPSPAMIDEEECEVTWGTLYPKEASQHVLHPNWRVTAQHLGTSPWNCCHTCPHCGHTEDLSAMWVQMLTEGRSHGHPGRYYKITQDVALLPWANGGSQEVAPWSGWAGVQEVNFKRTEHLPSLSLCVFSWKVGISNTSKKGELGTEHFKFYHLYWLKNQTICKVVRKKIIIAIIIWNPTTLK